MAINQLVVFGIDNEEFGIDVSKVNIIERSLEIFKIPNVPGYIEGLVNLRGKVHTVFDLRKRFNMPAKERDENTKTIMVDTGSSISGIIVDEVKEIIKVDESDIEDAPKILSELKSKYVSGAAKVDERMILLLDIDSVLSVS